MAIYRQPAMVGYAALELRGAPIIAPSAANPPYKIGLQQITGK
jgi:hypothetical protein